MEQTDSKEDELRAIRDNRRKWKQKNLRLLLSEEKVSKSYQRKKLAKSKYGYWSVKDKETLFSELKCGHEDIQKLMDVLPKKRPSQIRLTLRKYHKIAEGKFKRKRDPEAQFALRDVHPWLPFVNMCCNDKPVVHNQLPAFLIPILEQCGEHPAPESTENIDFRLAYRALFCSLTNQRFPEDMNVETLSLLYASLSQLLCDVRTEKNDETETLRQCIKRCLNPSETKDHDYDKEKKTALQLPEVNVFGLTSEEINLLCRNIS